VAHFERAIDAQAHEHLRLRLLFAVAVLKLFNFIGGAWDIQWHIEIGRDSLFIPPHMLVFVAFLGGVALVTTQILYETALSRAGQEPPHALRLGLFRAPGAVFAIFFGYTFALFSAGFDELWHRIFGIDATLWSPPHLMIMAATVVVDFSLLLGIAISCRRLGYGFDWKSPLLWGIVLVGAYAFESVNFQMGEAFIVGYRFRGIGLYGLLYPILVGAMLPLSLVVLIRLSKRFWIGLLVLGLVLCLQYLATGIAAAGFAILKPVSVIDEYVQQNPNSTAAVSREFARLLGFNGLIGFHQAWTMALAAPALVLVAGLGFIPAVRSKPLIVAPVFSVAMVVFSAAWFELVPALRQYPISPVDILAAALLAATGGFMTGQIGLFLAGLAEGPSPE
jgi:hypothetical protein